MTKTNINTARFPQVMVINSRISEKATMVVATYVRVSSDIEWQVDSYIAQLDFYSKQIASKGNLEIVDTYADEGVAGLEARNRYDFNWMLIGCWSIAVRERLNEFSANSSHVLYETYRNTSGSCGNCSGWAYLATLKRLG